ncbi:hypothetical protein J4479_00685 [Candidatus Woesearchaeota archaeon]|nr:hypothetical protein [Candidatus Woesearchaeota archaeon]
MARYNYKNRYLPSFKGSDLAGLAASYATKYAGLLLGIHGAIGAGKVEVKELIAGGCLYGLGSLFNEMICQAGRARQLQILERQLNPLSLENLVENNLLVEEAIKKIIKS